jgi:hypothetical protein
MVLVLAALVLSCQPGQQPDSGPQAVRPAIVAESDRALANSPVSQVSEFGREVLADAVLTLAEYERAILGFRECMQGTGYTLYREWLPTNNHGYQFNASHPGGGPDETNEARALRVEQVGDCKRVWAIDELSFVWASHHRVAEGLLQRARVALAACLRDRGEDFPEDPTEADFARYHRTPLADRADPYGFRLCQERIEEEFDLPGFGG